jgi:CubicO group peptidase (beta-lactamase class C family)
MADDTIFRIYSMTKPITSVALMQLWEQGRYQLTDPVHRFLPAWENMQVYVSGQGDSMETRAATERITVKHLLTHTAGLSYGFTRQSVEPGFGSAEAIRSGGMTLETFAERLSESPLMYEPGTAWMYSYATDMCGYLVQVISGMPFDEYLRQNIFEPLGMHDTAFWVPPEKLPRFAANYTRGPEKQRRVLDDPQASRYATPPSFLSGGGGLTSTTADYLRFAEMLRRGGELDGERIIGPRTLAMMTRNHLPGGRDLGRCAVGLFSEAKYEGTGFGLGFAMTIDGTVAGLPCEGEYFWGGAASTYFWVDPKDDLVCIFMTQLVPSATFDFRGQLKDIVYAAIDD